MTYGPPHILLFDNDKQFTSKIFRHVCKILVFENRFTATYRLQTICQVELYNGTITATLRHYIDQHTKDWDLYTDIRTFR